MDGNERSYEQSYDGRKTALPERVEVRARPERRRRWSSAAKLAIVRETLAPGSVAQVVADRHGIGTGLIYTWRKQMLRAAMAGFVAVEIKPEGAVALPSSGHDAPETPPLPATTGPSNPMAGVIEVELPSGVRLRLGLDVDSTALRRVLAALQLDAYGGALFVFRGRRGDLIKALHWDGQGLCLYAKRLELPKARFVWPQTGSGTVSLTGAQISMLLEGIDWRMPAWTVRPEVAV